MRLLASIFVALFLQLSLALANEVVLPSTFPKSEIPNTAPDGSKVKGLSFPTALLVKRPNGEVYALYGYINARNKRTTSYTYFRNDALNLTCWTIITPIKGQDPTGVNTCYEGDKILEKVDIVVPADKYGKMKGSVSQKTRSPSGVYQTLMTWNSGRKFPDIEKMLAAFQ